MFKMINKVLIAEDHESANLSVQKTLEDLSVIDPDHVYYCDDALLKIQKGVQVGRPYDLLITDLYFEVDHARQNLSGGAALIAAARKVQPDLRVLVFSAESKAAVIEALFEKYGIDGYVRKARNDARDLKTAIEFIDRNERYLPRHLAELVKRKNVFNFKEFDIAILSLMAEGVRQKDLPDKLRERNFEKSSLSTIEKRLKTIREVLEFTNNEQLIAYSKDMGIV